MLILGDKIKELRLEKHLTQSQLAQLLGITKSMVSAYETATRYPSYDILIKLSTLLGATTDFLLGLEDRRRIDISNLSPANIELISSLISALERK